MKSVPKLREFFGEAPFFSHQSLDPTVEVRPNNFDSALVTHHFSIPEAEFQKGLGLARSPKAERYALALEDILKKRVFRENRLKLLSVHIFRIDHPAGFESGKPLLEVTITHEVDIAGDKALGEKRSALDRAWTDFNFELTHRLEGK